MELFPIAVCPINTFSFQVIGLLDVFHPSTSLDDFQQM